MEDFKPMIDEETFVWLSCANPPPEKLEERKRDDQGADTDT